MGVGLSYAEVGLLKPSYPTIGQTFYVVDHDYRTAAQGWSRADRTGPLDLYEARKAGQGGVQYVFRTSDYSAPADRSTIQAAIDQAVDFRGDTVFLTPGSYSIATTALDLNVANMRFLGPQTPAGTYGARSQVTLTDAIGVNTISADNIEVGFMKFIPLTALDFWNASAGADSGYFHDYFYDVRGIAASTATIFMDLVGGTNDYWVFKNFWQTTDEAQGPHLDIGDEVNDLLVEDFLLSHGGGTTLAVALFDNTSANADGGIVIRRGKGYTRGAASTAVTNLGKLTDTGADVMSVSIEDFTGSVGFCASNALVDLNGAETAEIGLYRNYLMTISGGTGLGTVYTA